MIPALLFGVMLGLAFQAQAQVTPIWERSLSNENRPDWFGANTERGMGFGVVDGIERVYVASRSDPIAVRIIDAATGLDAGTLNMTGVQGGYLGLFPINDVDVSEDGKIFACNMTLDASDTDFRIWMWEDEDAAPELFFSFSGAAARLGDKFTVVGSLDDRTLTIYAAASRANQVFRWVINPDGETFTGDTITLDGVTDAGIQPSAGPKMTGADSEFYFNGSEGIFGSGVGVNPKDYDAEGVLLGTIDDDLAHSNSIRYFTVGGRSFIVTYSAEQEDLNAKIYDVTGGADAAVFVAETPSLGDFYHEFESGDVAVQGNGDGSVTVYVLAGNNGVGAYTVDLTPTVVGTYYVGAAGTAPGGEDPDFETLKAAFDAFEGGTVSGDVNVVITSDLTEPEDVALGLDMDGHTFRIAPLAGTQPTVTFTATALTGAGGIDGHFVIGSPTANENNRVATQNLVIDGSGTEGGTSRDLTFVGAETSVAKPILRSVGDNDNLVITNTNFDSRSSTAVIQVTAYGPEGADDVVIRNNQVVNPMADGILTNRWGTLDMPDTPTGLLIEDNDISARRRGISMQRRNMGEIRGNTFSILPGVPSIGSSGVFIGFGVPQVEGTINVHGNFFTSFDVSWSGETVLPFMGVDIQLGTDPLAVTVNIYNNFFAGWQISEDVTNVRLYAFRHSAFHDDVTSTFANNTVYMPDLTNMTAFGASTIAGMAFETTAGGTPFGTTNLLNNIIYIDESSMPAYGIRRVGTGGTFTSDFNNIYTPAGSANAGFWNDESAEDLLTWQVMSEQDENSVSVAVEFVSDTDLRLAGGSLGDQDLRGTEIPWITEDIDGNERRLARPFMGAFEPPAGVPTEEPIVERPTGYELHQNYPNPFNPATVISYTLPQEGHVQIAVYDLNGRLVEQLVDGFQTAGTHEVRFDASNLASGMYLYRMVVGDFVETRRMTFVK